MSQKPQGDQGKSESVVEADLARSSPIVMVLSDPGVVYVSKPDFDGWEERSVSSPSPDEERPISR
jgi:hypothetical protein